MFGSFKLNILDTVNHTQYNVEYYAYNIVLDTQYFLYIFVMYSNINKNKIKLLTYRSILEIN